MFLSFENGNGNAKSTFLPERLGRNTRPRRRGCPAVAEASRRNYGGVEAGARDARLLRLPNRKFDERLDLKLIEPIRAWKGRYGTRGALRSSIEKQLQAAYPSELTTTEIFWELQIEFKLDFDTKEEKNHWQKNTVSRALKVLAEKGMAVRLHDVSNGPTSEVGRWRWISDDDL